MLNGTLKPNMASCDRPVTLGELQIGNTKNMVSRTHIRKKEKYRLGQKHFNELLLYRERQKCLYKSTDISTPLIEGRKQINAPKFHQQSLHVV